MREEFYWLNDDSVEFLRRGYLQEGVEPKERIRQIANTVEKISGMTDISDRFYSYMSKGWISMSSPIWSNFGLEHRGYGISCVTGDTWINTKYGGKKAKDIKEGDLVLTHKNRFKPVTKIIETKDKSDIYKLKVGSRLTNLYITGNHPVLTNVGWVKVEDLRQDTHMIAVNGNVDCYDEKDYTIDMKDFVYYNYIVEDGKIKKAIESTNKKTLKRNKSETHATSYSCPYEYVEVTKELAWCFGLWFADGSLSKNNKGEPNGIRITTNLTSKKELADKWLNIMSKSFNLKGNHYESEILRHGKVHKWLTTNFNGVVIGEFFKSFGDGAKVKKLPNWVLDLPKDKLESFYNGILDGDGSVRDNETRLTLSNPVLVLQMYNIGLKLGKSMSLQMQEKAGKLSSTTYVYTIIFRNYSVSTSKSSATAGIRFGDLIYCPIRILEKTDKKEDVYDFTVDEDHSFSCAGVIVHNCYGITIQDNTPDILRGLAEIGMMSKYGGGTAVNFSNIRGRGKGISGGGVSNGIIPFLEMYQATTDTISQNGVRRGSVAIYLDIDHDDIEEYLTIRDEDSSIQNLSFAVNVSDEWMQSMIDGDSEKRKIWLKVLKKREETGYPYIQFSGNVNNNKPQVYKDKNLTISHSNLCNEIQLYSSEEESFVCCISSVNLEHFDEWKDDPNFIFDFMVFLDSVMKEFIDKASGVPFFEKAVTFARNQNAVGLGVLGLHSYLQKNMIPFEGLECKMKLNQIFRHLDEKTKEASKELSKIYGEPPLLKGYGERFTTRMAIAPTTSSSFILGQVSPSIEPLNSNYFLKDVAKGRFAYRNPYLEQLLETKGLNTFETWESILKNNGSVQHLDSLSQEEKNVFKTFDEISQLEVVQNVSIMQKYVDQGISMNIKTHPDTPVKDINALIIEGWRLGVKGFYYNRSTNKAQELGRELLTCSSCEA